MNHSYTFFLTVVLLLFVLPAQAQQDDEFEQLVQEFNFTQAVYPQEKKEIQFTLTSFLLRTTENQDLDLGFSVEYGLTDRLQVEAEFVDTVVKPRNIDETSRSEFKFNTGILYNVVNRPGFSSSLALEFELPVKQTDDSVAFEYEPHIILAKQIGKGQVQFDAGAEIQAKEQEYFYNLTLVYPVGALKPLLELNGSYEDSLQYFLSPGLVWNGVRNLELITGTTFGLWQKDRPWGISFKLVYEFSLGNSPED